MVCLNKLAEISAAEIKKINALEKELGVVLLDIGGGTTDIAIFSGGSLVHTAVLTLGGNHLIPGSVSSPTMLRLNGDSTGWAAAIGRTYDLRVKIHIVASGANASGILVALAEPTIGFSYTPDPLPYQFIRPSAASGPPSAARAASRSWGRRGPRPGSSSARPGAGRCRASGSTRHWTPSRG